MKVKLIPADFNKEAFAKAARENKSWADLDDEMKGRRKPKPSSFKILGPAGKYTLIKWDTGDKEYCTDAELKKFQKEFQRNLVNV